LSNRGNNNHSYAMKKLLLLTVFVFLVLLSNSQTFDIKGFVVSREDRITLSGAHVILTSEKDSLKKAEVTNLEGAFYFKNIPIGNYQMKVSYVGFLDRIKAISVSNKLLDLGFIQMIPDTLDLDGVEISEEVPAAVQMGDTTQFNADAFKINSDATAEDLIQKMPGVIIQDGQVQAQGEQVQKVLVDGREFFGDDPNAALRNLPAEVIDKIQVFDQQSEQAQFTGFDDGETTKTMNIITREDMRNGRFGKVYGGYGYEDKYKAGGNINFFKGDSRISIIGQTNNVNIQNFSTSDILGMIGATSMKGRGGKRGGGGRPGATSGGGKRFNTGGNMSDFLVSSQGGINTSHAFGLNYSDKWSDKLDFSGSYFFNYSDNETAETTHREYVLSSDSGQIYDEDNISTSNNINHRFSMRLDWKIDSSNSILFRPRFTLQQNDGSSIVDGVTSTNETLLNRTLNLNSPVLKGYTFSGDLLYRHKFVKKGRTFSINLNYGNNDNGGDKTLKAENTYYSGHNVSDTLNQFADILLNGWSASTNLAYTEPLGQNGQLMFNYRLSYREDDSDKYTYNYNLENSGYNDLDTALSNVFNNNYITNRLGGGYSYRKEKTNFNVKLTYQNAQLNNKLEFPMVDSLKYTYNNLLPSLMFRYKFPKSKNLRLFYRARSNAPSVDQLQNVVDNSNPVQVSIGNPMLQQDFSHSLFVRYSSANTDKSNSFFAMLGGTYTNDYISNSTYLAQRDTLLNDMIIVPRGTQITKPQNVDGYANIRSFVVYGVPLRKLKSNFNVNLSGTYTRLPGYINTDINYSNTLSFGLGLVLSSNINEKIDFTISNTTNYSITDNSLQKEMNTTYTSNNFRLRINWIFAKGFVFRSDVAYQLYTGFSEGYNENYVLLNAGIGKKFLKEMAEVFFQAYDILDQNKNISRNVTDAYIEDVQSNVLQRYFMLTFTYKLRHFRR